MRSRVLVLFIACAAVCGGMAVADAPEDWRNPWKVTLALRPAGSPPDVLIVRLDNQGSVALLGENIVFSFYRDGSMYGWAIDPVLRAKRIEIPPGQDVELTSRRQDWLFRDLEGNEMPQSRVDSDLATGKWEITATLTDISTPKPSYESSFLIWSTTVRFGDTHDE